MFNIVHSKQVLNQGQNRKAFIVIVFAYNEIWSAAPVGATRDNI